MWAIEIRDKFDDQWSNSRPKPKVLAQYADYHRFLGE